MAAIEDYGVGTGSANLFGGGMSKQELDKLLGLYPLSQANPMSAQNVPTAEALSRVDIPFQGASDVAVSPTDNFQPEQVFTQRPMDLSASITSDLRNNEMQTQDPREYFTSGQQPQQSSIVTGMFPEVDAMQRALYQQKQNEAMQAQALQFAKLDPFQKASYGLAMGGQQLGDAIGGALGGKDPQLQQISMRNAIMRRLDPSDPAQQMKVAQEIAQYDPEFAMSIADNARKSAVQIAQANKENKASVAPDIQKSQRAAIITSAINQYKALPQTPEVVQAIETLQTELNYLKPKEEATPNEIQIAQSLALQKGEKGTKEYNAEYVSQLLRLTDQKENIIDVGVADKTREVVYFDKRSKEQFIMKPDANGKLVPTPYSGGIDKTTAKVTATASQKGETAFSEQLGKIDAKQVEDAMGLRNNAISALGTLERLNKLDEQGLISGSFATGRVGAANILATIGLISEKDQGILAASQNYQKTSGDLVLATLGGKLGSGFSNDDRKFIVGLVPQLETNALARKQLIEFMVKKNRDIITETTRLDDYARENKSLKGFVPKIPIFNVSSGESKSVNQMSKQELINAIEAKKREAQ